MIDLLAVKYVFGLIMFGVLMKGVASLRRDRAELKEIRIVDANEDPDASLKDSSHCDNSGGDDNSEYVIPYRLRTRLNNSIWLVIIGAFGTISVVVLAFKRMIGD